ncbi:hypothetical protein UO65_4938 [Actinokineospora spheciospongiae]|uniref:Uncharacterized protein n=1 Tax=Actinokineospora spheciospongiae TaxID=909613 RepID=W7IFW5_9PSEU|nr:hypothetical protein [Actinokineospora spheciospongiae]EWC59795.1 hypothetical protein UO65_4938 [Actinokineospora spheciospongiae]
MQEAVGLSAAALSAGLPTAPMGRVVANGAPDSLVTRMQVGVFLAS